MRTPPLAAVLVFVALLAALTMLRGAIASDPKPTPPQVPSQPFGRVPVW